MIKYDFDRKVDRVSTNDMKWHSKAVSSYLNCDIPEDMIPMWLADTDFACAPVIVNALRDRVEKEFLDIVHRWHRFIVLYVDGRKEDSIGM